MDHHHRIARVITRPATRRSVLAGSLAAVAGAAIGARTLAQTPGATPGLGTPGAGAAATDYLAVADTEAAALYVYRLPGRELVDRLDDVVVNAHAGFIPMPDGQLLFMDDLGKRLVALEVHDDHLHAHEASIPGTAFSHIAIDSDHAHYAAVGSDAAEAPITLVDLETWETTAVPLAEAGEVGLAMSHDILFHRNDATSELEAYAIEDLVAGSVEMLSSVPIGAGGHGESITMDGDTIYIATDDGIDAVAWDGEALTYLTTYAWDSDDRSGGRGYFQRLSFDGRTVVSYTADRSAPETEWTTWTNDAVLVDTTDGVTRRTELGTGYVYRFGLSGSTALYYRMGGDADEALVLDLATAGITARIPLEPMSAGPAAGEDIYAAGQYRAVTMTTDGATGFVSQGGDGIVVVLDLVAGTVAGTIATATPLDGGGYLGVFGSSSAFSDLIGR